MSILRSLPPPHLLFTLARLCSIFRVRSSDFPCFPSSVETSVSRLFTVVRTPVRTYVHVDEIFPSSRDTLLRLCMDVVVVCRVNQPIHNIRSYVVSFPWCQSLFTGRRPLLHSWCRPATNGIQRNHPPPFTFSCSSFSSFYTTAFFFHFRFVSLPSASNDVFRHLFCVHFLVSHPFSTCQLCSLSLIYKRPRRHLHVEFWKENQKWRWRTVILWGFEYYIRYWVSACIYSSPSSGRNVCTHASITHADESFVLWKNINTEKKERVQRSKSVSQCLLCCSYSPVP